MTLDYLIHKRPIVFVLLVFFIVWAYESYRGYFVEAPLLFTFVFVTSTLFAAALKLVFKTSRGEVRSVFDYRRPSAHVLVSTSLTVTASYFDNTLALPLSALLVLTMYNRWKFKAHTVKEIVEGFLWGVVLSVVLIKVAEAAYGVIF